MTGEKYLSPILLATWRAPQLLVYHPTQNARATIFSSGIVEGLAASFRQFLTPPRLFFILQHSHARLDGQAVKRRAIPRSKRDQFVEKRFGRLKRHVLIAHSVLPAHSTRPTG